MACDICGKVKGTMPLNSLLDWSLSKQMQICCDCVSIADRLLNKYRNMAWKRCKKKLKAMQKRMRKTTTND